MENVLSEQELKQNITTQETGEGEFVVSGSESGATSLFGPPKGAIKKVKKKFEPSFIPGASSVTAREVITDLSKISILPKLEDIIPTKNSDMRNEIDGMVGYKDKTGEVIPFSDNLDVDTKIKIMNLGGATEFVYKREDGEFDSVKIPYDREIAKLIKEPDDYKPPSERAIMLKATSIERAYTGPDASAYELFGQKKDQGRFPSWIPFIGGDKVGVTLDNALGTNFDETGGQIALAKAYNKILIKAGLNERQRYGILKERLANKFKDLFNIMGYGRRGIRFGIEAPVFIVGEVYDYLDTKLKENLGLNISGMTGTESFKDSVGRANFYDMIMPLQANIIQDGFAAQNINIDLGTAELLASMFTSTPARLAALGAEIGIPSNIATAFIKKRGKDEFKKYQAYRARKLFKMGPTNLPSKDPDFDKNLIEEFTEFRAKSIPFLGAVPLGDLPYLGAAYKKMNSLFTGPRMVHGMQIQEAGRALKDNPAVQNQAKVLQNLENRRTQFLEKNTGVLGVNQNNQLKLLNKQIEMASDSLRYEIVTANVPQFIKDVAKQNKAMIIGSASFGQLAQEGEGDVQVFEMIGLFSGLVYAMGSNQRNFASKIMSLGTLLPTMFKKTTQDFTTELAKRVNTFSPEFGQALQTRIQYIKDLQNELADAGVPPELLNTSFATMSNLALLQTVEETSRIDMNIKNISKFGSVIEEFQEIHTAKKELLAQLKEITLQMANIRKDVDSSAMNRFTKTVEIAQEYATLRANKLEADIKLLQEADQEKIKSIITGTVGKLEDAPNEDISSALNRAYKHGYSPTVFLTKDEIANHNKKTNDVIAKAVNDKAKSLRRLHLLQKARIKVPEEKGFPEYKNSDDLFFAFGENKRNFENAEVSKHYIQLDRAKFIDRNGKLVGGNANVEGMDLLDKMIEIIPKNDLEIYKEIGGGVMNTSKQSQIFKGLDQAASATITKIFNKLPEGSGFETADEFISSVLENAPSNLQNLDFMPPALRAVYIMHKKGETQGVTIDSLPLSFDQLKEIKSSFGRLQSKYFNPKEGADNLVSSQFKQLKQVASRKFGEFQINFGEENSRMVGDLFIIGKDNQRISVAQALADGDAAHQLYMNRFFDNKTNYNYFFKNRNKTTPSDVYPLGISVDQKPSFVENVDKIFKMSNDELGTFKDDFKQRFGTFEYDEIRLGDNRRTGKYVINIDSADGKALKSILELKVAEYVTDALEAGTLNSKEYQRKLLKLQKAYTGIDASGKEVSLIDVQKIEKDLFEYSPASVGDELYKKGENNLKKALTNLSKKNLVPLKVVYRDYKQVERNLRSVLPAELKQGQTLIEAATANPTKFKKFKEGLEFTFGGKYGKKELDTLITEVFMEDLLQKTFRSTGTKSISGAGKNLITDVDMDVDALKNIIGFNDPTRNAMVKDIIGEKRMKRLNSMVNWMSEQYDLEKIRSNITGIPRNFSVESYISRFYSINRGVISARYVGTEAVLQQFRLKGHKLFKVIIEDEKVGQLFMEIIETGQPLSREKEIQFFNALVSNLNKLNTYANSENPQQTVVINGNYKAKYQEYDRANQTLGARQ
tara:strand:+ start:4983 stop:9689 length:4707 start_codon:yes stop_codon:yes gene_type:complete